MYLLDKPDLCEKESTTRKAVGKSLNLMLLYIL